MRPDILDMMDLDMPPSDASEPVAALWWLAKGEWKTGPEWERAHSICQGAEGEKAHDWVHALAHWIEGDGPNSDYWYRRAGEARVHETPQREASHILNHLNS